MPYRKSAAQDFLKPELLCFHLKPFVVFFLAVVLLIRNAQCERVAPPPQGNCNMKKLFHLIMKKNVAENKITR